MSRRAPVTTVRLGGRPDQPLLLLGPALGTSARALWAPAAEHLAEHFQVVAWDLPGHGTNTTPVEEPFTMAELAAGVLEAVGSMGGLQPPTVHYAGVDVGGVVGLHLVLDAPGRVATATLLATGAVAGGLDPLPAPGPVAGPTAEAGYAAVCGALAESDVRRRLRRVDAPVLAVAGADDATTPVGSVREVADGVQDGRLVVLDGAGHLAPADAPGEVARLVREHALGPLPTTVEELGRELRQLGGRGPGAPETGGLDPRSASLVALTASVVAGRHEDLADEARLARERGVSVDEIAELLLHTAHVCGVAVAEAALEVLRAELAG